MDALSVKGTVKIYNRDKSELLNVYKNAFLNTGKQAFMKFLMGDYLIDGYKYIAIGSGDAETTEDMTRLKNEFFRKELSGIYIEDNKLILDIIIEQDEANRDWYELGLVMGGTSSQLNSGVLFNRVRVMEKKKHTQSITISWEIEVLSS